MTPLDVIRTEARAIAALAESLDVGLFGHAVAMIERCIARHGRVVTMGVGKSGCIAAKIAATFSSTGTPSFFVHPTDAAHGDMGAIKPRDVVLMISHSGETSELIILIRHMQRKGGLIAITGDEASTIARGAHIHIGAKVEREACPLGLAPSSSTTAALVLGDALAFTVADARGLTADGFAANHPGGALGRKLAAG